MTDEQLPARLTVKEFRHEPSTRSIWIKVEHFYTNDFGVKEGDPLYLLRQQDINRLWKEISTLSDDNATLREKIEEYREYFRLQKKLQEAKE